MSTLKVWARNNLEGLTIKSIKLKIQKILELLIEKVNSFQNTYNLTLPLKKYIVAKWMQELNFVYQPEKKNYMINIHEREDVVKNRNEKYLPAHLQNEFQESC